MLADEMRARVLAHGAAYHALRQSERHDYDPREFTITDDDRRLALSSRDPRALELELRELRLAFWRVDDPEQVRLIARRALILARHLVRRSLRWRAA